MRPPSPRLAVAALLLLPVATRANGFALDIQGVYANGTAGAAAGDPRDPAVQFVNPAGLAALDGTRVTAGGMLVFPRAPFTDGGSTLAVGAPIPGQNGDGAENGQVPWVFASRRVAPSLTLGLGLSTPFGLATDFGRDAGFVGRYQGIASRIESLAFGPALAWRVSRKVALGAALAARRDHVVQSLALDLGSACVGALLQGGDPDPAGTCAATFGLVPGASDGYGRFDGDGWSWTSTLGAMLEPADGTTIGIAWRHEARGKVRGDETFALPAGAAGFFAAVAGTPGALTGARAGMALDLPDFVTLHGARRLGPVKAVAALQWSRWKPFDDVALVADSEATGLTVVSAQRYRNAWRLALGAAWTARSRVDVYAGAAYEQTPIRDAYRQATLPETDSIIVGLGGEVGLGAGLSLALGWQHVEPAGRATIDQAAAGGDHLVGSARPRADLALAQLTFRG